MMTSPLNGSDGFLDFKGVVQSPCNCDGESLNGKFDGAVMQIVGRRGLARTFSQWVCATWIQSYFSLELGIPIGGIIVHKSDLLVDPINSTKMRKLVLK